MYRQYCLLPAPKHIKKLSFPISRVLQYVVPILYIYGTVEFPFSSGAQVHAENIVDKENYEQM